MVQEQELNDLTQRYEARIQELTSQLARTTTTQQQ